MLDRLISGAGALTDRADRLVRALTSGRGPDVMGNRPGSVLVIVILIVGSVVFGLLALESTDNPTPRAIAPAEVASADDIGRRVYATIEGVVANGYVETFPDDDEDGIQDADETGDAWYYFLVDESGSGVTVRSTRHPDDIYRYTATGVVVRDPEYVSVDVAQFGQLEGSSGIELDDTFYLDASSAPPGSPQPLDLTAEMPAPGTAVTITGPGVGWLDVCTGDADGDGECEQSEFDAIDAFIADPGSGRAITVLQADDQPATAPVQFTGMLRDEAASIRDANRRATSSSIRSGSRSRIATSSMIRRLPRAPDCRSVWRSSPDCWPRSWRSDSSADTSCSDGRSDRFHRAAGPWDRATRSRYT